MPDEHSRLSPSSAHQWRKCAQAPRMQEGLPDDAGIEAALGSVFHEVAAICLEFGLEPQAFIGMPLVIPGHGTLHFDKKMADNMLYGLDYVREIANDPGSVMYVETKVKLSRWLGTGQFGTSDVIVMSRQRLKMTCFDWKYGAGVPVLPEWNDQAILYVLGSWDTVGEEYFEGIDPADIDVDVVIEQPRAPGGGGLWSTTMAEILEEGRQIRKDAEATHDPDAPFVPGTKQCQFCKAAKLNKCKAYLDWILDKFDLNMDSLQTMAEEVGSMPLPNVSILTPEQKSAIHLAKPAITKWLENVHKELYADAEKGRPTPGLKMVMGRSPNRAWKDDDREKNILERRLGKEEAYTKKLLSPAQVEEIVGKKIFRESYGSHINQGDPKPELVSVNDRRDAIPDVQSRFDTLMGEDSLV